MPSQIGIEGSRARGIEGIRLRCTSTLCSFRQADSAPATDADGELAAEDLEERDFEMRKSRTQLMGMTWRWRTQGLREVIAHRQFSVCGTVGCSRALAH